MREKETKKKKWKNQTTYFSNDNINLRKKNVWNRKIIKFEKKDGLVLLDQIRTVDKTRLVKKLGDVDTATSKEISKMLVNMFEL